MRKMIHEMVGAYTDGRGIKSSISLRRRRWWWVLVEMIVTSFIDSSLLQKFRGSCWCLIPLSWWFLVVCWERHLTSSAYIHPQRSGCVARGASPPSLLTIFDRRRWYGWSTHISKGIPIPRDGFLLGLPPPPPPPSNSCCTIFCFFTVYLHRNLLTLEDRRAICATTSGQRVESIKAFDFFICFILTVTVCSMSCTRYVRACVLLAAVAGRKISVCTAGWLAGFLVGQTK